jgi:flagellar hook-associated protein 3 FlgL
VQLRIEVVQSQQTTRTSNIETLISADADADMATSAVKLSQTSTAYQAALSSASKILQMSLLDYLK